jgi:hydroxypyruvate reductase
MRRFEEEVLAADPRRRAKVINWLEAGLAAVDPQRLTRDALRDSEPGRPTVVVALGKAAPAMTRGAAAAIDVVGGICVSAHPEPVPSMVRAMVGDHPVPGKASFEAGTAVLETVINAPADARIIALISGGGSAVCESPRPGVTAEYLTMVTGTLLKGGADIEELNLVRRHLSSIKCGGLARAAARVIDTFVISDVGRADPGIVASGPTIPAPADPAGAREVMTRHHLDIPSSVWEAMTVEAEPDGRPGVTVVADGLDAARAALTAAPRIHQKSLWGEWLGGEVGSCLDRFLAHAGPEITIGCGETVVDVIGSGIGGRNTHAALMAAQRLAGTDDLFVSFATDGVDGESGSAGAIVNGTTIQRGGDPAHALADFDSARYLAHTGDLLICPPTGTNVADLWILWRQPPAAT